MNFLTNEAAKLDIELFGMKSREELAKHLEEEVGEFLTVFKTPDSSKIKFEREKELGDVLFCLISICSQHDLDLETSLKLTMTKLQERIKFGVK